MIRRTIDIAVALASLLLASPLMILLPVVIRADSPGGVLYGGWRVGKDGRRFKMWKFRTMVADADRLGPAITSLRDPRITRIGHFLRRTKLDELPQLYNLLKGDLTLVGPRAEVPEIVELYTPEQRRILEVRPGLTGPATLDYTLRDLDRIPDGEDAQAFYVRHLMGPKLDADLAYLRQRSAWTDLGALGSTAITMLKAVFGR